MATEGAWDVLRLLDWTKGHFIKAKVDNPRLCAEVLLAHALHCKRIELYTRYGYSPAPAELEVFRGLVKRAADHEPVAYLIGEKEFYSLRFKVTPDVLVPRESELLVAQAVSHLRTLGRAGLHWDACTGSGCIAVATAFQVKDVRTLATDISPGALAVATENAAAHHVADRVRCREADGLTIPPDCADWKEFDVITANPPYVAEGDEVAPEVLHEPALALRAGADGLACIGPIIRDAPQFLAGGGVLILEFGYGQADAVRELIVAAGAFGEPKILRDQQDIERTAVVKKKQG